MVALSPFPILGRYRRRAGTSNLKWSSMAGPGFLIGMGRTSGIFRRLRMRAEIGEVSGRGMKTFILGSLKRGKTERRGKENSQQRCRMRLLSVMGLWSDVRLRGVLDTWWRAVANFVPFMAVRNSRNTDTLALLAIEQSNL